MSMYFIGIDISKYKHDCCIISAADQKVVSKVTIKNNKAGFDELLTIINSLSNPEGIRIGFESTAHYALNLELFLESSLLTFMEVNPVLISEYKKSKSLRAIQPVHQARQMQYQNEGHRLRQLTILLQDLPYLQ